MFLYQLSLACFRYEAATKGLREYWNAQSAQIQNWLILYSYSEHTSSTNITQLFCKNLPLPIITNMCTYYLYKQNKFQNLSRNFTIIMVYNFHNNVILDKHINLCSLYKILTHALSTLCPRKHAYYCMNTYATFSFYQFYILLTLL